MRGRKGFAIGLAAVSCTLAFAACGGEKNVTVVAREQGSGTREAFDKVVTDGAHYLEEKDEKGNKVYHTTVAATIQTKTGAVMTSVASDKNAIGYISLGSVNETVKMVEVDGVAPSAKTVLNGTYKIQRPFVIMTNANVTLTAKAADFMDYLYSLEMEKHAEEAGCIFVQDPSKRANEGEAEIAVGTYEKQESLPAGDKIVIRGSTSLESFINNAAKGYADAYSVRASDVFDIQLEGSSVGRKAVEKDTKGNVIGLSSAAVRQQGVHSFNVCLDAVAVVVNKQNERVNNLTLKQLYNLFSGKITKFSELD